MHFATAGHVLTQLSAGKDYGVAVTEDRGGGRQISQAVWSWGECRQSTSNRSILDFVRAVGFPFICFQGQQKVAPQDLRLCACPRFRLHG